MVLYLLSKTCYFDFLSYNLTLFRITSHLFRITSSFWYHFHSFAVLHHSFPIIFTVLIMVIIISKDLFITLRLNIKVQNMLI